MGGEIHLDDRQQHAMHFASVLRQAGHGKAAEYLESIYVTPAFGIQPREPKTLTFEVSALTKEWAFASTESVIRALAGNAIQPEDKIIIKHRKKKKDKNEN